MLRLVFLCKAQKCSAGLLWQWHHPQCAHMVVLYLGPGHFSWAQSVNGMNSCWHSRWLLIRSFPGWSAQQSPLKTQLFLLLCHKSKFDFFYCRFLVSCMFCVWLCFKVPEYFKSYVCNIINNQSEKKKNKFLFIKSLPPTYYCDLNEFMQTQNLLHVIMSSLILCCFPARC